MANKKKQQRICSDCGCEFEAYPPAKRCKPCKDINYMRLLSSRPRRTDRAAPTRTIACANCGVSFVGGNSTKYCTPCAVDRITMYNRKNNLQKQARYRTEGWPRVCIVCKKSFISMFSGRKYCDDCSQHQSHTRKPRQQFNADACIYARQRANGDIVYKACIHFDGEQVHLGYFPTREAAKEARIIAYSTKYNGEPSLKEETP